MSSIHSLTFPTYACMFSFLVQQVPLTRFIIKWKSLLTFNFSALSSFANFIPVIKASFFALLFDALKRNLKVYSIFSHSRLVNTFSMPLPCTVDEPSTQIIHADTTPLSTSCCNISKFASTIVSSPLVVGELSDEISNSLTFYCRECLEFDVKFTNPRSHRVNLPDMSTFCIIYGKGQLVSTIMICFLELLSKPSRGHGQRQSHLFCKRITSFYQRVIVVVYQPLHAVIILY